MAGFPEYALAVEREVPDDEVQDAEVRMTIEWVTEYPKQYTLPKANQVGPDTIIA